MKIKRYALFFLAKTRRATFNLNSALLKSIRLLPYLSDLNRLEIERMKMDDSYIKFSHYAQVRRALHEQKFKMKNSDYCSVKINWEFFGEVLFYRSKIKDYTPKFKHKSTQSTFFPDRNQRVYY